MTAPSTGYAQIATSVADLKAIASGYRADYYCIFLPAIGSWVYYLSTSTATADDVQVFLPNDGVGRWLVTNQLPYIAAAYNAAAAAEVAANAYTDNSSANAIGYATSYANSAAGAAAGAAASAAASAAVSTHVGLANPHTQYVLVGGTQSSNQSVSTTPTYAARVVTGGSTTGGFQAQNNSGVPGISIGVDGNNRGTIVPGANGLTVGGNTSDKIGFFGRGGANGSTAITLAASNTTDTIRAINATINLLKAVGLSG